jgi:hypothetical protein
MRGKARQQLTLSVRELVLYACIACCLQLFLPRRQQGLSACFAWFLWHFSYLQLSVRQLTSASEYLAAKGLPTR